MRHFIITFVLFFAMLMANAQVLRQVIERNNVKLSQIIGDTAYNLNEPIRINDSIQEKVIKKMSEIYRTPGSDDDISNVCITAFMKWCDKFVGEKRDYVVLRLPFNKRADRNSDYWPPKDELKKHPLNHYESNGAKIVFDPFVEVDTLNGFLVDNKVVLAVSKVVNGYLYVVNLNAVMPYNGKSYRYETTYYFFRQLDFEVFKTRDVDEICSKLGKLIAKYPSEFVDPNGWIAMNFLSNYFRWDFDARQLKTIREIDINPDTERITVKSLFYDNY